MVVIPAPSSASKTTVGGTPQRVGRNYHAEYLPEYFGLHFTNAWRTLLGSPKPRPMLSTEDEVRSVLLPHHQTIATVFASAWKRWQALPPSDRAALSHPRCHANSIWGLAVDDARAAFAGDPRVEIEDKGGTVNFRFEKKVLVRFKKLNRHGRTRNFATQLNLKFAAQVTIAGFTDAIRVHVGYVLNALKTEIDFVKVSCPAGRRVAWTYDIPLLTNELPTLVTPEIPVGTSVMRRARLRPRKLRLIARDGTTGGDDVKDN